MIQVRPRGWTCESVMNPSLGVCKKNAKEGLNTHTKTEPTLHSMGDILRLFIKRPFGHFVF